MDMILNGLYERNPIALFKIKDDQETGKLREICNGITDGRFYLARRYPAVQLQGPNIWISDPLRDRSWRFWLHTLVFIEYLVDGYEQYADDRYLNKAISLLLDWSAHNDPESATDMAWHDHAAALRLLVICRLFEAWRPGNRDTGLILTFTKLAETHCLKLVNPGFYRSKHNHGMDQDIALFAATVVFEHIPSASEWRKLALKRFILQLRGLIAEDGSYLEHSPGYGVLFLNRLYDFMIFLKNRRVPEYQVLQLVLERKLHFLTHIVQPDGQIPPLGDSQMLPVKAGEWAALNEETFQRLQHALSGGTQGACPAELDAVFPAGGYAVFRNQWKYDPDTVQLVFQSCFHSKVHKHHDDLAVTLYAHGQPLLIDSGKYNYDYASLERQYVVSNTAHNTVVADDTNSETVRLNTGKSGLTTYHLDREFSFVAGAHCLYPGTIHQRLILFCKPWDILVLDWLEGYKEHKYEQVYNFDPRIHCSLNNGKITGVLNGRPCITLTALTDKERISSNLVHGRNSPLRGWCSLKYGELTPVWSAGYISKGVNARFATHINTRPYQQSLTHFSWENDLIDIGLRGMNLKLIMTNQQVYLAVNDRIITPIRISQPILEHAMRDSKKYEYKEKYRSERKRRLDLEKKRDNLNG